MEYLSWVAASNSPPGSWRRESTPPETETPTKIVSPPRFDFRRRFLSDQLPERTGGRSGSEMVFESGSMLSPLIDHD